MKISLPALGLVLIVASFVSQLALVIATTRASGIGFFEYLQISEFGMLIAQLDYSPIWTVLTIAAFLGGIGTAFYGLARR